MKYNNRFTLILITILLFGIQTDIKSQDRRNDFNYWTISLNGGATLLWGDMTDDVTNPFSRYFTKDQQYAGALTIGKNFNPFLSLNFSGIYGGLTGYRDLWSSGNNADLYFKTTFQEANLNLEIDILNIFNPKPRLFNMYIKGGFGMIFYDSKKYSQPNDVLISNYNSNSFVVPWGWGIRFDLSEKIGISFENTFHHAFSDELDAHDSKFTDVNDIYNYTSLGISYRMFTKDKKPSIEEPPIETIDTLFAEEEPLKPLDISINGKGKLYPGERFLVNVKIDKDRRNEKAKLQFSIPLGFDINEIESGASEFNFVDQVCSFTWDKFPEKKSINISFAIIIGENVDIKEYKIPGILFYNEDGQEKIRQINLNIKVENPPIAENNEVKEEKEDKVEKEDIAEPVTNKDLVYRVQVRAIYGGKSSTLAVSKMYNLDKEVIEDYDEGYMKYLAGNFNSYDDAKSYKEKLRNSTVEGAFVVAYYKGERLNDIKEAIKKEGNPTSSSNLSKKVPTEGGTIYRIQIAASSRNYSEEEAAKLFNINDKVELIPHNGLNKYLVGSFKDYNKALNKLENIKQIIPDAFIVKFIDGKRQ